MDQTNVFVKYLPAEMNDESLRELFSPFGSIISTKVMLDPFSGSSLGYGFVRFTLPSEAHTAIKAMAGHRINKKTLLCKLSNTSNYSEPSTNLYIKPLSQNMTEDDLKEVFSKYGKVITVKIVTDHSSLDNHIGFVRYEDLESATNAIKEMNGASLSAGSIHLTVKFAESDVQRAARKANTMPPKAHSSPSLSSLTPSPSLSPSSSSPPVSPRSFSLPPTPEMKQASSPPYLALVPPSMSPFALVPVTLSQIYHAAAYANMFSNYQYCIHNEASWYSSPSGMNEINNQYNNNLNIDANNFNDDFFSFNINNNNNNNNNCNNNFLDTSNFYNYYYPNNNEVDEISFRMEASLNMRGTVEAQR